MPENKPLNVLEIAGNTACAFAGKLFAEQGADVVLVEPPTGHPLRARGPFPNDEPHAERSGLFVALNVNKRSVCLDLEDTESINKALHWADILILGLAADIAAKVGLDRQQLTQRFPSLVTLCITPFGIDGPYADYIATELIVHNAGGWANLCPATHQDPALPPLKVHGDQCHQMAGIAGATTAMSCIHARNQSGVGEFIDLSVQAYVASVLEVGIPAFSYRDEVPTRLNLRSLIPWRIFQAKDGPVFIVCVEQDQWERLVEFMGSPEWAALPTFATQPDRAENQDMVHMFVQEFVSQWQAMDLYHAAQRHRICVAPVMDLRQLQDNEHLRARNFFSTIVQPTLGELELFSTSMLRANKGGTRASRHFTPKSAPALGEHTADFLATDTPAPTTHKASNDDLSKPLTGIRVLDLTWAWAGPFCSMNLAHLGAEVIRIESPERPDLYRRLPVYPEGFEGNLNASGMFNQWNQGKSSIALDLRSSAGIALVKQLISVSDVVVQNFASGVMQHLGLGFDVLSDINPGIIMASISGYGQSGPYTHYMGYGPAIPPLTGLAAATGFANGGAEEIGLSMPDPTSGITAAWGIVAALNSRSNTGVGQHLDVTLWEATGVLNSEAWMDYQLNDRLPQRSGNRVPDMAPHGVYPCAGEDRWIAIACRDDNDWRRFEELAELKLVGCPAHATLRERKLHEDALDDAISAWTNGQDRWQLTEMLQRSGIAAFPTLDIADVVNDPQLAERQFIERLAHPEMGRRAHAGVPWRLWHRPNGVSAPAPRMGADTKRHLRETLGLEKHAIEALFKQGVVS